MLRLDDGTWSEAPLSTRNEGEYIWAGDMATAVRTGRVFAGGDAGGEIAPRPLMLQYQN
jgi:hypothetical protein